MQRLSSEYRLAWQVAAGFFLIYLAFMAPGIYSSDGTSMLAVSESIAAHHSFTVPENVGVPGVGGRIYSRWYPLLSILAVPFVYAALVASRISGLPFHYLAAVFVLPLMSALVAATGAMVALLSVRLGADTKGAWLASISFGLGTIAPAYAREFYADALLAFLAISALCLTISGSRKELLVAVFLAALAILSKPTGVFVGPLMTAYLLAKRTPLRSGLLPLIGTGIGGVIYMGYNLMRFGGVLNFGVSVPLGLGTLFSGVAGQLVSPGCGVLWYCPPVALAAFGFRRIMKEKFWEALAIVALFVFYLVFHSTLTFWHSGWSWGPRYLLPGIPGLCALAGLVEGRARRVLAGLTLLGFIISAPTWFSFYERYYAELAERGVRVDADFAWSPSHAPLLHIWPAAMREVHDARSMDTVELFRQREVPRSAVEESRALRIVAVWWWVLPVAHISRWVGFLLALLLTALGSLILAGARFEPLPAVPKGIPALAP